MLTLVPGGMGGSETYARELLAELADRELDVRTLVPSVAAGFSGRVPERVVTGLPGGGGSVRRAATLAVALGRRRRLSHLLDGADVVHHPFTVPLPPARPGSAGVVTLHDVQHHDLPAIFTRTERAYRQRAYDRPARRADAVITISEFCRQRIVHHLGIDAARVHVARLGARPVTATVRPREAFLLYPARGWPHKNHARLFEALALLRRSRPGLRLVLTGSLPGELAHVPDGVEVRGRVPLDELDGLYATAAAMVFPSRYEGFGLPVVEAMAAGCPVAAARAGALPEISGGAAELFDPDDPAAIAAAVERALERADELAALGRHRARQLTWTACADAHVALYRRLGG